MSKGKNKVKTHPEQKEEAEGEEEVPKDGRWTKKEHALFVEALGLYGKDWKKVQAHVVTRTTTQARSHAQKYFAKLGRKNKEGGNAEDDLYDSKPSGDSSEIRTQVSTPVDSPLGGPFTMQRNEPSTESRNINCERKSTKKSSKKTGEQEKELPNGNTAERPAEKSPLVPSEANHQVRNYVSKRMITYYEDKKSKPTNKVKMCTPDSIYNQESLLKVETLPNFKQPTSLWHSSEVPMTSQYCMFDYYGCMPTMPLNNTLPTSGLNYGDNAPLGQNEPCVESELPEFDNFQLDTVEKPLDLQAVEQQPTQQPKQNENENITDFSDIFSLLKSSVIA